MIIQEVRHWDGGIRDTEGSRAEDVAVAREVVPAEGHKSWRQNRGDQVRVTNVPVDGERDLVRQRCLLLSIRRLRLDPVLQLGLERKRVGIQLEHSMRKGQQRRATEADEQG